MEKHLPGEQPDETHNSQRDEDYITVPSNGADFSKARQAMNSALRDYYDRKKVKG